MKNKQKAWRKSAESINRDEGMKGRGRRYRTGPATKFPYVNQLLISLVARLGI